MSLTKVNKKEEMVITDAEWEIMRVIWANGQMTSREIIDTIHSISDWKEGTIKTLINRLTQKGFLTQHTDYKPFLYTANVTEYQANIQSIDKLIDRICTTRRHHTLNHLIQSNELGKNDIAAMIRLLEEKYQTAPEQVRCQCPVGQCNCHL